VLTQVFKAARKLAWFVNGEAEDSISGGNANGGYNDQAERQYERTSFQKRAAAAGAGQWDSPGGLVSTQRFPAMVFAASDTPGAAATHVCAMANPEISLPWMRLPTVWAGRSAPRPK
jgi:hypothetical protein